MRIYRKMLVFMIAICLIVTTQTATLWAAKASRGQSEAIDESREGTAGNKITPTGKAKKAGKSKAAKDGSSGAIDVTITPAGDLKKAGQADAAGDVSKGNESVPVSEAEKAQEPKAQADVSKGNESVPASEAEMAQEPKAQADTSSAETKKDKDAASGGTLADKDSSFGKAGAGQDEGSKEQQTGSGSDDSSDTMTPEEPIPENTKASVTVKWVDDDNAGETRPAELEVELLKNGTATGQKLTLNLAGEWSGKIEDLPANDEAGDAIQYTWQETKVPAGYLASSDTVGTVTTLTNALIVPISVTFGGTKTFEGYPEDMEAPTFEYVLTETTEGADYTDEASTEGAGAYIFKEITYDAVGTHTSTVKEKKGDTSGITYDETEYEVTVQVTDSGQGKLAAEAAVEGGVLPSELDFTNTYGETPSLAVKVSKVDAADGKALAGAELQVLNKAGEVVETWTSAKEAHEITGLSADEEYTLAETKAPAGYLATSDATFSIDGQGQVTYSGNLSDDGVLLVEDSRTSVSISKVDAVSGWEVAGASLRILDSKNKTVAEWTSKKTQHVVLGLTVGEKYTVVEDAAPIGYGMASEVEFVLEESGELTTDGATGTDENDNPILLIEDPPIRFEVSKIAADTNKGLGGATLVIYELTANNRVVSEDGVTAKVIHSWVSKKDASYDFGPYLESGKRYLLVETKAPEGYRRAGSATVTVSETGEVKADLTSKKDANGDLVYLLADARETATVTPGTKTTITPIIVTVTATPTPRRVTQTPTKTATPKPTTKATSSNSSNTTNSKTTSAKTGDDSPVAGYLILMAAACMAILAICRRRSSDN